MATCKYCHASITRIDKDVCPFCGGLKPLENTDTSTQDVTKILDQVASPVQIKHKKRIIAAILAALFGFLGLNHFYLGKFKKGLIALAISVVFIIGLGSIVFFVAKWESALAFLVFYFPIELFNLFLSYSYLTRHNIQDSHGEFLD